MNCKFLTTNFMNSISKNDCLFRKRHDVTLQDLEKQQEQQKEVITKLQQNLQQTQAKAAPPKV